MRALAFAGIRNHRYAPAGTWTVARIGTIDLSGEKPMVLQRSFRPFGFVAGAATRLTTQGYGDTKPLVPNTTDDNRFKNRRVELKKNNCK